MQQKKRPSSASAEATDVASKATWWDAMFGALEVVSTGIESAAAAATATPPPERASAQTVAQQLPAPPPSAPSKWTSKPRALIKRIGSVTHMSASSSRANSTSGTSPNSPQKTRADRGKSRLPPLLQRQSAPTRPRTSEEAVDAAVDGSADPEGSSGDAAVPVQLCAVAQLTEFMQLPSVQARLGMEDSSDDFGALRMGALCSCGFSHLLASFGGSCCDVLLAHV